MRLSKIYSIGTVIVLIYNIYGMLNFFNPFQTQAQVCYRPYIGKQASFVLLWPDARKPARILSAGKDPPPGRDAMKRHVNVSAAVSV